MELEALESTYWSGRIWGDRRNRTRMGSAAGTQNKAPPRCYGHVTSEENVTDGVERPHSATFPLRGDRDAVQRSREEHQRASKEEELP